MADLYGTLAGADAYHAERGNAAWTGTDADKDAARLRASEYIDAAYRSQFPGYKAGLRAQVREWPRVGASDIEGQSIADDETPREVENATYEASLRELVTPGSLNPDYDPSTQVRREKVGPIDVEYTAAHGPNSVRKIIPIIGAIIAPVLTGSSVTSSITGRTERI